MPVKKAAAKKKTTAKPKPPKAPDFSALPRESFTELEKHICLACVLDVFTRHLKLAAKTANLEVRRYTPSVAELQAAATTRPYFAEAKEGKCPYCGSSAKWHAKLSVYRIESGKAADAARRELVKSLPTKDDQFVVLEEKATRQHAFFEWLEKISVGFDLDDPRWIREVSRHYLSRKEPKTDWQEQFRHVQSIRRSRRIEEGWELDNGRLFLAPLLFDELLLVQYLVSRSQKAGGLTLEGRYTLPELFVRLRNSGYLRAIGITAHNPNDVFEQLVEYLSGGESSLRFYYIVDRRDFLEKAKAASLLKPPRPKPSR